MTDNGVNISNREIYDAVLEVSAKLDNHIEEHRVRDAVKRESTSSIRYRITTWVAVLAAFLGGGAGILEVVR